jgi:hypothetical protein
MVTKSLYGFILLMVGLMLYSCQPFPKEVKRGMYYWKSNEPSLSQEELGLLQELSVEKLYVKFFEVEPDPVFSAKPISKTRLRPPALNLEVIPTVFIHNEALKDIEAAEIDSLASNIHFLCTKYYHQLFSKISPSFSEIQLDCDWTPTTKDAYFQLIRSLKQQSGKRISCTLRLYPYKYQDQMGVPPVDRVTLMCYSLTNPLAEEAVNSIQDNERLEAYLRPARKYPIPVDIALPLFSWALWYQNNQFAGILRTDLDAFRGILEPIQPMWYQIQEDTMVGASFLRRGDKVKLEEVSQKETLQTLELLKKYVHFNPTSTITLFHLDVQSTNHADTEMLDQYFTAFQQ